MKPHQTSSLRVEVPVLSINKAVTIIPTIIQDKPEASKKAINLKNTSTWKEMKIDVSQLGQYYLKLSKFRLTCKYSVTVLSLTNVMLKSRINFF